MDGGEIFLVENVDVFGDGPELNLLLALGVSQGLTKFGFSAYLLSDKLVDRQVEQVVLDSKIGAGCVYIDALLMVYNNDLGAETAANICSHALLRAGSVNAELFHSAPDICPADLVLGSVLVS